MGMGHTHDDLDPNAKEDLLAFQPGFLEECQAALDAGFEPDDTEPRYLPQNQRDAVWDDVEH